MDKNQQKALGLIFILFLLLTYKQMVWDPYFFGPKKDAHVPAAAPADTAMGTPAQAPAPAAAVPSSGEPAPAAAAASGKGPAFGPSDEELRAKGEIALENQDLLARLTLLGGRLSEVRLRNYRSSLEKGSGALNLIAHSDGFALPLGVYFQTNDSDASVLYRVVSGPANGAVELRGLLPDGREITKKLSLRGYILQVAIDGLESADVEWTRHIPHDSPIFHDKYNLPTVVWYDGHRASRSDLLSLPDAEKTPLEPRESSLWISEADKYFTATMISADEPRKVYAFRRGDLFITRMAGRTLELYLGPKSYRLLAKTGHGLEKNIDFGWLGFLSAPLLSLLHTFYNLLGNYGLAIVALTILVKLLLLPLTASSFKQMKAMQDIQPDVKRIRDNVKDKQQQQVELMSLYKKRGVNPLGGCFPILLQLPIFLGLYNALNLAIELRHAPFALWIQDLSAPEKLHLGPVAVPVLVILFVISMIIQQWTTPSTMDPVQKKMMLFMPVVFGFLFANFPAGLTLYWLVSNVISIGQTKALRAEGGRSPLLVTGAVALSLFAFCAFITLIG